MAAVTRFTDPAAVDIWDHWFRWRDAEGRLRDRTIDATWSRVAEAISGHGMPWAQRYIDAFSRWQLLPDERLLRTTGTGVKPDPGQPPSAALNVAAFVVAPLTRQARFDDERFARIAALAVHLLDDALLSTPGLAPRGVGLRVGVIGFSDALRLLGIHYDDARAIGQARAVGKALAMGTVRGAIELACERGPIEADLAQLAARCRDRGLPPSLVDDLQRHGVRHADLTAITRHPRLALLANRASDALDPPWPQWQPALPREFLQQDAGPATMQASAVPANAVGFTATGATPMTAAAMLASQRSIRAAIQPWIDAPIDDPWAVAC